MAYETLLSPTTLGSLNLPNRVIMAPLTRSRTPDSVPGKMQEAYYGQRAGAGLIISEATNISPTARGYVYTPGIWTDEQEAGWKGVVNAVHAKGGRIALQLWHVGRVSHEMVQPDGQQPVAPSALKGKAPSVSSSSKTAPRASTPPARPARWRPTRSPVSWKITARRPFAPSGQGSTWSKYTLPMLTC